MQSRSEEQVNFRNQRRIANPSPSAAFRSQAESAYRQYRVVRWFLLPEVELCLRPAANAGLPIQWTGTIWPDCYIYGCASAEQINLFCTRLLRNLADAIYTAAPRQLQTSLHCSRLLRIFAAGIEVWCNGSTTDFGSVCPGSNPGTSTEKVRPFDRTFLIHSSFLNVYVSRGLQIPCNVEPVASRRPQALTFRHQPRRSRPAGSIGRRGGSYCRRTSSGRGRQSNTIACEGCLWPEATRHGPPPEVEFIGNNEVRSLSDPGGPVVVG